VLVRPLLRSETTRDSQDAEGEVVAESFTKWHHRSGNISLVLRPVSHDLFFLAPQKEAGKRGGMVPRWRRGRTTPGKASLQRATLTAPHDWACSVLLNIE
jgi:hypothetical protein